ncbi:MAG: RNA polymerase sigma factor [Candidatus Promineifilaceae bacterium]
MARTFSPDLTDAELIALILERGGKDDRPYQELLRRHQQMVWRVCYGFTRQGQDAEDLTQEVFFKAFRNLHQFQGKSSFKTWLYRIAINTSQNELRRRSRRPQVSETDVDTMANYLPSPERVEQAVSNRQRYDLLQEAMASLPPDAYEILKMRELEQLSYSEIADALNIGLSAAKMRVQRARRSLQAAFQQLECEP